MSVPPVALVNAPPVPEAPLIVAPSQALDSALPAPGALVVQQPFAASPVLPPTSTVGAALASSPNALDMILASLVNNSVPRGPGLTSPAYKMVAP